MNRLLSLCSLILVLVASINSGMATLIRGAYPLNDSMQSAFNVAVGVETALLTLPLTAGLVCWVYPKFRDRCCVENQ